MSEHTRIIVADDHLSLVLTSLENIFQALPGVEVLGGAENPESLWPLLERFPAANTVFLDMSFPEISDGLACLERLVGDYPQIKVVIYSMHLKPDLIKRCLEIGAHGYLTKNTGPQELIQCLNAIRTGKRYLSDSIGQAMAEALLPNGHAPSENGKTKASFHLTRRQLEIIRLIALDHKSQEVADKLGIEKATVDTHRRIIKAKAKKELNISTMIGLIVWLIQHGLLTGLDDWVEPDGDWEDE